MAEKILIVEDDDRIAYWLAVYLQKQGYQTHVEHDGKEGFIAATSVSPDLIILDLMLPSMSGKDICQALRKTSDVPIIMLTAKSDTQDRVDGLNIGADDYMTKPFEPEEVVARVQSVLRRTNNHFQNVIECPPFSLNFSEESLAIAGNKISLPHTQFQLLATFMKYPNQVLSREKILQLSFGKCFESDDRAIDNHISRLRKRISYDGHNPLKTVYGAGYKFVP